MIRYDRWGTARQPNGPNPSLMRTPWIEKKLSASDLVSHSPAIDTNGVIYYGSWLTNLMRKVDVGSGTTLGSFDTLEWIKSSPAIGTDHTIYFNVPKTHSSLPGRIYALNPNTMNFDWFFNTNQSSSSDFDHCSPIIGPGSNIITGSTTGTAWRFLPTAAVMWETTGLQSINFSLVMTRDDTKVIVPNGTRISALNYSNGAIVWTFNAGSNVGCPGVAPDGTIVVGSDSGTVYGLNPNTGSVIWTNVTLDIVRGAPAFSSTNAYVCSYDRRLYSFRLTDGFREWSFLTGEQLMQGPVVGSDGRIYTNGRGGQITSLSPAGGVVWQISTNREARSSMSMDDKGRLYVPGASGVSGIEVISQDFFEADPTAISLLRGVPIAGGLSEILGIDQNYYIARNGITTGPTDPPIQIVVDSTAPTATLSRMDILMTAGVSTPNLNQKVEAFDWTASNYVVVDSRVATTSDSQVNLTLTTNINRFVSVTKVVRVRVSYTRSGPTTGTSFDARLDQVHFQFSPGFTP